MRISRVSLVMSLLAAAAAPVMAATAAPARQADKRPNIVLLLADDLGWTDIHEGATNLDHGNQYVQTPTIDRLATQGMSFTNMHMCPNCAPTRASLMTGQYSAHNGVYNVGSLDRGKGRLTPADQHGEHIRNDAIAMAETLRAAGYATCHVGKYHVSTHEDVTQYDGFDVNYGGGKKGDASSHGYFAVKDGDGWYFTAMGPEMNQFATPYTQEYVEQNLKPFANGNDPSTVVGTKKHLTDAEADAAIDYMTRHLASPAERDKPFFMNVAFNAVHTTIKARPDLMAKYEKFPSTDDRHKRPDFAGLTEGEDQAIARILKFIDDNGLADNTLVLFTSDNGGSGGGARNAPLRLSKGTFYEGGLRVPMIARLPGVIQPGSVSNTMVNVVDLYPTFADFAAAKLPNPSVHALDGYSFAPVLRGQAKESTRDVTYYHFPGYLDLRAYPCSVIIKRLDGGKEYKLLYSYEDQHYELYNLTDDLGEAHDLLAGGHATDADRQIASSLRTDLNHWLTTTDPKPLFPKDPATGKEVPLPIPVEDALKSGNVIQREAKNGNGKEVAPD